MYFSPMLWRKWSSNTKHDQSTEKLYVLALSRFRNKAQIRLWLKWNCIWKWKILVDRDLHVCIASNSCGKIEFAKGKNQQSEPFLVVLPYQASIVMSWITLILQVGSCLWGLHGCNPAGIYSKKLSLNNGKNLPESPKSKKHLGPIRPKF